MSSRSFGYAMRWGRVVLGLGLAAFLLKLTLDAAEVNFVDLLRNSRRTPLLGAVACFGAVLLFCAARWRLLLRVQGVEPGFAKLLELGMIGFFFSALIPGAVSGDLVKMAYIAQQTETRKAEAILTIMLDRVLGLIGLFLLALLMVLICGRELLALDEEFGMIRNAVWLVAAGSMAGLVAVAAIEFQKRLSEFPLVAGIVAAVNRFVPDAVATLIGRFSEALDLYRTRRGVLMQALILSVCVHAAQGMLLHLLGQSVGEERLRLRDHMLAAQVANSVASIPATPGGFGTRDTVLLHFYKAQSADRTMAASVPILQSAILASWALIGGLVFAFAPKPERTAKHPTEEKRR